MTAALQIAGLAAMWVVVILLLPQALNDGTRRVLWTVVVLVAVDLTLHRPQVQAPLYDMINGHIVFVGVHLVSVGEGIGVLYLLVMLVQRPRLRQPVVVAGALVSAAMIAIYVAAQPPPATVDAPPDVPLPYWHILSVFHTVTHALAVALCWQATRNGATKAMQISLMALSGGLLLSCLPWALNLGWLLSKDAAWLTPIGSINAITGLLFASSATPPLASSVHSAVRHRRAARLLEPLWRDLTTAVPDVVFAPVPSGVGAHGLRRRLYRRVVEVRDAMLVLGEYVTPKELTAAQEHIDAAVPEVHRREAAVTACWLAAATAAKARGDTPRVQQNDITSAQGGDLDAEVTLLLEIARWYRSPTADRYRARLSPNPVPGE